MSQLEANDPAMPADVMVESGQEMIGEYEKSFPGLTVRQEFAARFMQSLIGVYSQNIIEDGGDENGTINRAAAEFLASEAIALADALIARLNKDENAD